MLTEAQEKSFNENYNRIDWIFKASLMKDFDDIKSEILMHIWTKWHLYDESKSLSGWVSTITKNQFINILRNTYQSTSSPCLRCPCNLMNGQCSLYGEQGNECDLYAKWQKSKKYANDIKMPLALDYHLHEIKNKHSVDFNIDTAIEDLHVRMQKKLTPSEWEIYKRLYVENKDDETTAKELNFKSSEKGRKVGYGRLKKVSSISIKVAKKILTDEGI
jgi:DNA-directed RNA polymerase specialized sigma24 family protein